VIALMMEAASASEDSHLLDISSVFRSPTSCPLRIVYSELDFLLLVSRLKYLEVEG
jgi:hypothetical protein